MGLLNTSIQNLGDARDSLGVNEQSLTTISTQLSNEQLNVQSAMSNDYDTNMASAISQYTAGANRLPGHAANDGQPPAVVVDELHSDLMQLKPKPRPSKQAGLSRAVGDVKDGGKTVFPTAVAGRAVLPGVAFDGGHAGDAGGQAGRMEE